MRQTHFGYNEAPGKILDKNGRLTSIAAPMKLWTDDTKLARFLRPFVRTSLLTFAALVLIPIKLWFEGETATEVLWALGRAVAGALALGFIVAIIPDEKTKAKGDE